MVIIVRMSVINQKGGVGKTTTAINLSGELISKDYEVLLVDLDPQGNATESLGEAEMYDADPPNLCDVLVESDQRNVINELRVETESGIHLIPSNVDMTAAEPELTVARRSAERLLMALDELRDEPDFLIVDPPPSLGNLTDNAMLAAPNLLIPALAESTSKRAFELLFDHRDMLEEDFDITINEIGVVINRVDVRKKQANEMVKWIESAFDDVPVWSVRERADIQKALENQHPLCVENEECDMNEIYRKIAECMEGFK